MGAYDRLLSRLREAGVLSTVSETLSWDQETMMPERASAFRAEELSLLARLVHERVTAPALGDLLATCEADTDLDDDQTANLREIRHDYDRSVKLPADLVAEITKTSSLALGAWKRARKENDFSLFEPWLSKQVELHRKKADCYGAPAGGEAYDALVEDFEPGMTAAELERIFDPLREALRPLIAAVHESGRAPGREPSAVPVERQQAFNQFVLGRLGFELDAGRLDVSAHPFSTGLGPGDTRITTRYREDGFLDAIGSTLHEAGHGLYEQGLPKYERFGEPLAQPVSLGIHESQSRLWENHVGRSRGFWEWAASHAREICGASVDGFGVDDFYGAMNRIEPNLIRVESDEVTYHMHIMLRFELERAMLRGDLIPRDLPSAWNERVREDLGIEVPDDARGCLQDVHWSMGYIGYFPTYTLGSLYAAQLFRQADEAAGGLAESFARGRFDGLLSWLRANVHDHGRRYPAGELCRKVTGDGLSHEALIEHAKRKIEELYGVA